MAERELDLTSNTSVDALSIVSIQGYPTSIANGNFGTVHTSTASYPYPQVTSAGGYPNQLLAGTLPLQDAADLATTVSIPYMGIPRVNYKFNEGQIMDKVKAYIDKTYAEHYSEKDGIQALDFIMSNSDSYDFLKGNVLKYTARYGKKDGHNPKDILKAIHYLVLLYHFSLEKK